jgi:hypothetical protein
VTTERNKLLVHNEELNDLYFSPKIEKNEMGGACSAYGGGKRLIQGFGEKTWGKETI